KRKRKAFTIKDKMFAIDLIKNGESQANVARYLNVAESTVRGWLKNEGKLISFLHEVNTSDGLTRKKARSAKDSDLDFSLYAWFMQERQLGMPISGPILRAQAERFNRQLGGPSNFKASQGWLHRFQKRHGISISGRITNDRAAVELFQSELKKVIEEVGYTDEQIYNCDETGLCFKLLPDRSMAVNLGLHKGEGFKKLKDRVTVLFCINKKGNHKLKPLCVGKSEKPRCFHHVNMNNLPFAYTHSKNACMTPAIFEEWFYQEFVPEVRHFLRNRNLEEKAMLLLDHCPAHPPAENLVTRDGRIRVLFLPKNAASEVQPLDQGIISTFKMNFRCELAQAMLNSEKSVAEFLRELNLKEMFYLGGHAWGVITSIFIEKTWMKALGPSFHMEEESISEPHNVVECEEEGDLRGFAAAEINDLSDDDIKKWALADDSCPTAELLVDEDMENRTSAADGIKTEDSNHAQDVEQVAVYDESDDIEPPPSAFEAYRSLELGLRWLETQDIEPVKVLQLRSIVDFAR
uniref:HTH CENPB-type domain-containing protein n=1 Tax=Latimeria chalumnae TaxID=7897 RepID=H3A775_LATCH